MIQLREITKENYKEIIKLTVQENQKDYVCTVEKALAAAYVYRDCIYPFAIYYGETPVGFIMCRYNKDYKNYFIWQLIIDKKYQNKGYGKQSLFSLLGWIYNQNKSQEIVTTITNGNTASEKLYKDIGFVKLEEQEEYGETDYIYRFGD